MDLYILDSLLRRIELVDDFESLIWTERWQDTGDFQLDVNSSLGNRTKFYPGTFLAMNNSNRVMQIEEVEDSTVDGDLKLTLKGRSIEALLEGRTAQDDLVDVTSDPRWVLNGTPVAVAEGMFDHVVRSVPALDPGDVFPYLQAGSMYPTGTILPPSESIRWEQRPTTLLEAIRSVCISYELGFRLTRKPDTSELYFEVYPGNDLTVEGGGADAIIFSPLLGTLENVREYKSIRGFRNVAYVRSEMGVRTVYAPGYDSTLSGFERKAMYVDANFNTGDPPSNVQDALEQIGQEELAKQTRQYMFDGEVPALHPYTYGVDYEVGDLVEVRNLDGVVSHKRVTEQIFVMDQEGERAYPTLAFGTYFGEDDWLAWTDDDTVWSDMTTEEWEDM